MQIKNKALKAFIIYIIITLFPFTGLTFPKAVIEAANAFHDGTASKYQMAVVFAKNKTINHMRLYTDIRGDVINDDVYQANQRFFQTVNDQLSQEAAKEKSLICNKQISLSCDERYNPGTDTDNIVRRIEGEGKMTLNDIKAVRLHYNKKVKEFLNELGYENTNVTSWTNETDTDFLPDYNNTEDEDFKVICKWINKNGGVAYRSINAVKVEFHIRNNQRSSITIPMAMDYDMEMTLRIKCVLKKRQKIRASILEDIGIREQQAIINKLSYQALKYLNRRSLIQEIMMNDLNTGTYYSTPREGDRQRDRTPKNARRAVCRQRDRTPEGARRAVRSTSCPIDSLFNSSPRKLSDMLQAELACEDELSTSDSYSDSEGDFFSDSLSHSGSGSLSHSGSFSRSDSL